MPYPSGMGISTFNPKSSKLFHQAKSTPSCIYCIDVLCHVLCYKHRYWSSRRFTTFLSPTPLSSPTQKSQHLLPAFHRIIISLDRVVSVFVNLFFFFFVHQLTRRLVGPCLFHPISFIPFGPLQTS